MGVHLHHQFLSQNQPLDLQVSTDSAQILAQAFQNTVVDYATVIAALLAAISAFFSYLAIRQNAQNQKDQMVQNIYFQFLDINKDLASRQQKFTKHDYELLANFLDMVGELYEKKKISLDDIGAFKTFILENHFVQFVENYRNINGKTYFESLANLMDAYRNRS